MGIYAYKSVRDQLPSYLTDDVPGYEGDADYNGDQWDAASEYIDELEKEIAYQYRKTGEINNKKLEIWLKTRPKTFYTDGPAVCES